MKKFITAAVFLFFFFLWSPWMSADGAEDVVRSVKYSPEFRDVVEKYSKYECNETGEYCCEGPYAEWAPFGRTVKYCEFASWYVPFWGE